MVARLFHTYYRMKKFICVYIYMLSILSCYAQQKQEFYFKNGTKAYFVTDDGKYAGVEDASGKIIIPKVYGRIANYGNLVYCFNRQGAKHTYNSTIYDSNGKELIPESAGYDVWDWFFRDESWYGTCHNTIIDENGIILYKFKECKDSKGFPYLINEIADTIVISPGAYTKLLVTHNGYIQTYNGSRVGICKLDGTEIIPATTYSKILSDNGKGFQVYNGTAGYLDSKGKVIIPTGKYDHAYSLQNGMFEIELNDKAGIVDSSGMVKFWSKYQGLSPQKDVNGNWYYVSYLGNGRGNVSIDGEVLKEPLPTEVVTEKEEQGFKYYLVLGKNGMSGVKDDTGKLIIPQDFYTIMYDHKGQCFSVSKRNGRQGIIDKTGKVIIPCDKYDMVFVNPISFPNYYEVVFDGKHGLVDKNGKEIIPPAYDRLLGRDNVICAQIGFMEGVIDYKNKTIIPFEYTNILPYKGGTEGYTVELYGKKGVCDKNGNIIIPPKYSSISHIKNDRSPYSEIIYVKDGDTQGIYTNEGKMLFPTGLFKHVFISEGKYENRVNEDWFIRAYNERDGQQFCYDLDGVLICEYTPAQSNTNTTMVTSSNVNYAYNSDFDKWFENGAKEFKRKNYKKAIESYKKAIEFKKDGNTYYNIGVSYYNLRKYKDAISNLQTCIQVTNIQSTKDDANDLIIECRECIQRRKEQRACLWLGLFCTAVNVAATVVQHNQAVSNYNNNLKNRTSNGGIFVRDTSLDYLTDPRYAFNQVQQENWREYMSMTNGGQTMTFEQWYANVKAPALQATNGNYGASTSNSSFSNSGSNSYASSSGSMCKSCVGSGDCKTCDGRGYYFNSFDLQKKVLCPNCESNHNGKCAHCHGTGTR